MLGKIVRSCAREPSFKEASDALAELAEVTISSRQAGRIAHEVGQQLQADRDQRVEQFQAQTLKPHVETRPAALAIIGVDGGRLAGSKRGGWSWSPCGDLARGQDRGVCHCGDHHFRVGSRAGPACLFPQPKLR